MCPLLYRETDSRNLYETYSHDYHTDNMKESQKVRWDIMLFTINIMETCHVVQELFRGGPDRCAEKITL